MFEYTKQKGVTSLNFGAITLLEFINDLSAQMTCSSVSIVAPREKMHNIQKTLDQFHAYCYRNKVIVNTGKTKPIAFNYKLK